ncbi:hypothetical protein CF326_g5480 [Tilletia indica]|nr:hypothetical protein CF326_g5480 [Tilletia indica]
MHKFIEVIRGVAQSGFDKVVDGPLARQGFWSVLEDQFERISRVCSRLDEVHAHFDAERAKVLRLEGDIDALLKRMPPASSVQEQDDLSSSWVMDPLPELDQDIQEQFTTLCAAYDRLQEQFEDQSELLSEQAAESKAALALEASLAGRLAKVTDGVKDRSHQSEIAAIRKEHEEGIASLKRLHNSELSTVRLKLVEEHETRVASLTHAHSVQLAAASSLLRATKKANDERQMTMVTEHAAALLRERTAHEAEAEARTTRQARMFESRLLTLAEERDQRLCSAKKAADKTLESYRGDNMWLAERHAVDEEGIRTLQKERNEWESQSQMLEARIGRVNSDLMRLRSTLDESQPHLLVDVPRSRPRSLTAPPLLVRAYTTLPDRQDRTDEVSVSASQHVIPRASSPVHSLASSVEYYTDPDRTVSGSESDHTVSYQPVRSPPIAPSSIPLQASRVRTASPDLSSERRVRRTRVGAWVSSDITHGGD